MLWIKMLQLYPRLGIGELPSYAAKDELKSASRQQNNCPSMEGTNTPAGNPDNTPA
jgi:hypothetical protein